MRYINGEEIKYEFTKPKTYMRPVFESLEDGHVRLHHIDVDCGFKKSKFVPIEHVSKRRRRTFELEEENAKLRELLETAIGQTEEMCSAIHPNCDSCPLYHYYCDEYEEHDECYKAMTQNKARELGVEVGA